MTGVTRRCSWLPMEMTLSREEATMMRVTMTTVMMIQMMMNPKKKKKMKRRRRLLRRLRQKLSLKHSQQERLRGRMRAHRQRRERLKVLRSRLQLKRRPMWKKILPIRMEVQRVLKARESIRLLLQSKSSKLQWVVSAKSEQLLEEPTQIFLSFLQPKKKQKSGIRLNKSAI